MSSQRRVYCGKKTLVPSEWGSERDTKIWYQKYWERSKYHRQKIKKLTFRTLAPPQSEKRNFMYLIWDGRCYVVHVWRKKLHKVPTQSNPNLKSTWPILAISLALLVISLAKAYSRVFMSNCHISTPTFSIHRLVNNNCKTEYHRPNFRT